jgi:hypothetical protein
MSTPMKRWQVALIGIAIAGTSTLSINNGNEAICSNLLDKEGVYQLVNAPTIMEDGALIYMYTRTPDAPSTIGYRCETTDKYVRLVSIMEVKNVGDNWSWRNVQMVQKHLIN